ncbi:alpha/beta fold hydrolase [Kitasatospora sp. CB01950]|uniref:alpha/beta fold hydrolase n=1 Tax=Kitasatospora sp. CB01950 TaxID=1703930 RepID=UPI00093D46E3|nr:alpha/beta fold hydrolase [Kitasatospora sp. CB01950]
MVRSVDRFVETSDGGKIFASQAGVGSDLVLLNAGAMDLRMWDSNLGALAAGHRVTRYDDRGTGTRSAKPVRPWSFTRDLLAVLDALDVARPVLVGSSDGGRKALDFAVAHPDRVSGLILVGTAMYLPDPDPEDRAALAALLHALTPRQHAVDRGDFAAAASHDLNVWSPRTTPEQRARIQEMYADSPGFFAGWPAEPLPEARPGIEHLGLVQAPTTVVVGEHETDFTRRCALRISHGVSGTRRIDVPGADHFVNLTRPDAFHQLVTEFRPA